MKVKEIARVTTKSMASRAKEYALLNPGHDTKTIARRVGGNYGAVNTALWRLANEKKLKRMFQDGHWRYYAPNYLGPQVGTPTQLEAGVVVRAYRCQECGKEFGQARGLNTHRLRMHSELGKNWGKPGSRQAVVSKTVTAAPMAAPTAAAPAYLERLVKDYYFESEGHGTLRGLLDWVTNKEDKE